VALEPLDGRVLAELHHNLQPQQTKQGRGGVQP
jgi:hypothetical protein